MLRDLLNLLTMTVSDQKKYLCLWKINLLVQPIKQCTARSYQNCNPRM